MPNTAASSDFQTSELRSMTPEERLVRHVCMTTYADLPAAALEAARREVLWCLGTSFAGASAPGSELVLAFARQTGQGRSTVVGHGSRIAPALAGFANGCFAKALEFEDKWWMDYGCAYAIGTAVVPAAFAMAEELGGVSGKDLLAAVAIATDVEARLIKVVPKAIYTGWNPSYLFAAFGAAIAAGRLLRLNGTQMHHALGLAYAQAAGNRQSMLEGVLGNRLQMGFAVRNGVSAAQLAALGVTGAGEFLTGKFGLYALFFKEEEQRIEALTDNLGAHFLGSDLGFKAYPCCAATHPALDAIQSILGDSDFRPERVESVAIFGSERMRITVEPRELRQVPKTQADAQFSMAWSAACLIVDRRLRLSHYTDATLGQQPYAALSAKVQTHLALDREQVSVEICLDGGCKLHSSTVQAPKGHPENPLSIEEIIDSSRDCVRHGPKSLPEAQTEQAMSLILQLQDVADVAEVIRLLA